jgi:hypothetical protein
MSLRSERLRIGTILGLFTLLGVIPIVLAGCSKPGKGNTANWVSFRSESAKFSALYPAPPTVTTEADGERVFLGVYTNPVRALSVRYLPKADTSVSLGDRLSAVRESLHATNMITGDIDVDGNPGMEGSFESDSDGTLLVLRHRMFYMDGALYQIIGVREKGHEGASDIDRFLAGVHFTAKSTP